MSPLRSKKHRTLAIPFLVTAAACTAKPAPNNPQPQPASDSNTEQTTPVILSNPPRPAPTPKATDESKEAPVATENAPTEHSKKPVIIRNPPPPDKHTGDPALDTEAAYPVAPKTGGQVRTHADGSCWWSADVSCPPKTRCNPPPPRRVQCPPPKK